MTEFTGLPGHPEEQVPVDFRITPRLKDLLLGHTIVDQGRFDVRDWSMGDTLRLAVEDFDGDPQSVVTPSETTPARQRYRVPVSMKLPARLFEKVNGLASTEFDIVADTPPLYAETARSIVIEQVATAYIQERGSDPEFPAQVEAVRSWKPLTSE